MEEVSLIKKLLIFWNGRKLILSISLIASIISLAVAFYLPPIYKAECHFLPPNQYINKLGVFVSVTDQSDLIGGLSNPPVVSETVTSAQMMLGLIKRDSILDIIIDKFSLMEVYDQKYRVKMRQYLVKKILETNDDTKSGIVSIGILDKDPQRAADIANAFLEALQNKMLDISLNEAAQRRAFFERQLFQARQYLDDAQKELRDYQDQLGGVAIPQSQMEATLRSITEIQQQIADKKVEISAMRTYVPSTNPRLRAATSQLAELTKELERLEAIQKTSSSQLSVEYQRHEMRVQYATRNYEALLQKAERARLDESQGFFQLQIVDYAKPPDFKYKPSKAMIIILGTFIGFILGCGWIVFVNFRKGLKASVKKYLDDNPDSVAETDEDTEDENDSKGFAFFKHFTAFAPALLCAAGIMFFTFQSPDASMWSSTKFQKILMSLWSEGNAPLWLTNMEMLRGVIHIFLFLPLSMAIYYALRHYVKSWPKAILAALVISCALGLADEAIKMYLPQREFDFADWIFDVIGSATGIILIIAGKLLFRALKRNKGDEDDDDE